MQARGLLNYRLKYCWPKVIHCICQPNELERDIKKKTGGNTGGKQKSGGPWPTQAPPLEFPLDALIPKLFTHDKERIIFFR